MENPNGLTRWSTLPVAAQLLAILPVLGGISGSTKTICMDMFIFSFPLFAAGRVCHGSRSRPLMPRICVRSPAFPGEVRHLYFTLPNVKVNGANHGKRSMNVRSRIFRCGKACIANLCFKNRPIPKNARQNGKYII